MPASQKRWDVFYVGSATGKPTRIGLEESVLALGERGFNVCVPTEQLSIEEYLDCLGDSRIAVSPPGLGWDCHRHYEAAMVGSVLVTPPPTIQRHAPFLAGEHCLFYDVEQDLTEQLGEMLSDHARLDEIAAAGHALSMGAHRHREIFSYVVDATCGSPTG